MTPDSPCCLRGAPDLLQLLRVALEWVLGLQLPALYESSPFQDLPCCEDPREVPSVSLQGAISAGTFPRHHYLVLSALPSLVPFSGWEPFFSPKA